MASIFISYRREDARAMAGWIQANLRQRYGNDAVFRDIDQIAPASDFEKAIGGALRKCDVFVAIIGKDWLGTRPDGTHRVNDPNDWIASELEMALRLSIPVVPVLVERATMPSRSDLPEKIREVTRPQAIPVDPDSFDKDIVSLHQAIDERLPDDPGRKKRKAASAAPAYAPGTAPSKTRGNLRLLLIIFAIIAVIFVIAGIAGSRS